MESVVVYTHGDTFLVKPKERVVQQKQVSYCTGLTFGLSYLAKLEILICEISSMVRTCLFASLYNDPPHCVSWRVCMKESSRINTCRPHSKAVFRHVSHALSC